MSEPSPLIEHLEAYLGRIESGWKPHDWADPAIQVAEFRHGQVPGVTVIGTVGLSSFGMASPVSRKEIRQELFVMVRDGQLESGLSAALDQVARECVRTDTPVLRGQVIRKQSQLLRRGDFVALYATLPIYYPSSFWTLRPAADDEIVFCWLLPIKDKEASYVHQHGWSTFEEILDKARFDVFDLNRPSLV